LSGKRCRDDPEVGEKVLLKTEDKAPYDLDDQERAQKYEGKKVEVVGTLDEASR